MERRLVVATLAVLVVTAWPAGSAEPTEYLTAAQANQLDAYDVAELIPRTTMTTPIPSHTHDPNAVPGIDTVGHGNDVNGQLCTIIACSFILSGLRVFDIRDPLHPREIAYFNPPTTSGIAYAAMSAPAFMPERNEIWYTDVNYGFYALRVTNGIWPH